jgi:hypothetical protein
MAIFRQYDPNMLAASVDEAYLKQVLFSAGLLERQEGGYTDNLASIPASRSIAYNTI